MCTARVAITTDRLANVVRPDAIVVGAGAVGLCCALALQARGRDVLVLEATAVGAGSSHGNCGTLTPSHAPPLAAPGTVLRALKWMFTPDAPLYVHPGIDPTLWRWLARFALRCNPRDWERSARAKHAMLAHSLARIQHWVGEYGLDCGFRQSGEDYIYRDARLMAHDMGEFPLLNALGISTEAIGAEAYLVQEPALKPGIAGAVRFSGDAMLRPDRYVAELARVFVAGGGRIVAPAPLQALARDGADWVLQTPAGAFQSPEVVLATGAWSPLLARTLQLPWLRHAIQPGKGYSITYSRPELTLSHPVILRDCSVCVTTWADGYRLGSTMEFSGHDSSLNPKRLGALERGAATFLHQPVGPEVRERWYGWRPMSLDDVPLIGASGRDGLWLATGHGMMGMGMSAGTGELIADLISQRQPALDPAPFAPLRMA